LRIAFIKTFRDGAVRTETILNVFPSEDEHQRLVVAIERVEGEAFDRLVLRQESFSSDVGWFVQSRIAVEPEQIPGLKMSLTGQLTKKNFRATRTTGSAPSILRFDRLAAGQAS
jgi:hypothetical protein